MATTTSAAAAATTTNPYDNFTPAALADEITLKLSSKVDCNLFEDSTRNPYLSISRPYINLARSLIYRMNLYRPPPIFEIKEKDIPLSLARALRDLGPFAMNQVITEAIIRLYESVDHDYFHMNGLYGRVRWRFSKK